MDDLRNLPDTEIVDFLRRYWKTDAFVFYGVFVPNTERPDAFSGMMTRVKVPGSKTLLKYPFVDNGFVSFKVPANKKLEGKYYKFGCHLQPNAATAVSFRCSSTPWRPLTRLPITSSVRSYL